MYDAMLAESIMITGDGGDTIEAYSARPLDGAPRGGVVVIHHMPGYDDSTRTTRPPPGGPRAASPTIAWWATWPAPWRT